MSSSNYLRAEASGKHDVLSDVIQAVNCIRLVMTVGETMIVKDSLRNSIIRHLNDISYHR